MHLYRHLTSDRRYDQEMRQWREPCGLPRRCETDPNQAFWAKATLGDLEVLIGTPDSAKTRL